MNPIIMAIIVVTVIGLIGAVILVAASIFMYVPVDERVEKITGVLAGANCGACGCAGCADYAKTIVEDGNAINHVYISKKYFNFFRKSEQGRVLAASFLNQVITTTSKIPVPSRSVFLEALADEFGATFHIVDAAFKYQKPNGETESVRPWEEANIVGLPAEQVGRLVYGTLAEETNPVAGVSYQKSGSHILVSKYSKTDPLEEFTAGQALVIPVIDGADSIYLLHANEVNA